MNKKISLSLKDVIKRFEFSRDIFLIFEESSAESIRLFAFEMDGFREKTFEWGTKCWTDRIKSTDFNITTRKIFQKNIKN